MIKVAIVTGSTRPGRKSLDVAKWAKDLADKRGDATFDIVDIADHALPLLDEPVPPAMGKYSKDHTKKWAAVVAGYDAYVFVTPEYNHGTSAALKNALDYLFAEWNNKACAFIGYGVAGGARAIENLRLVVGNLQMADVTAAVTLSLFTDFENFSTFKPAPMHEASLKNTLDQVVSWGTALKTTRK